MWSEARELREQEMLKRMCYCLLNWNSYCLLDMQGYSDVKHLQCIYFHAKMGVEFPQVDSLVFDQNETTYVYTN
jgi:hypothetical protein